MPTQAQHLRQADRNAAVAEFIHEDGRWLEWTVTALFYQAVHLVNAFLQAKLGKEPDDHRDRQRYVQLLLKSVSPDYDELFTAGLSARYDCRPFTDADVNGLRDAVGKIDKLIRLQITSPKRK